MTFLERIYRKAALARAFELECEQRIKDGTVKCPCYLSTGQEYPSATVATWCEEYGVQPQVFVQHRAHSQYLAFGGDPRALVRQILHGMGGSNCIQSPDIPLYGHDSLLGTQVPIAVGAAYGNRRPTVCFMGDAACEEDYVLAALGWAATHKLQILFVVEDNGLSILTEKKVRRSWEIMHVARGFGLTAENVSDDPKELFRELTYNPHAEWPLLLNVRTARLRWHSGAGTDDSAAFDRHSVVLGALPTAITDAIDIEAQQIMEEIWNQH